MDEPSSSTNFQPGDLLWAKMKGFPPWPAKVLEMTVDTPARRIPVMFFGTLETSFMKPADLSDYMSFRKEYEIARKQKDFNKAVREIRRAAGISSDQDESSFPVNAKSPPSSPSNGRSTRQLDVMISTTASDSKRKRSNSASTKSRSRASSTASAYRTLKDIYKKDRRRLDSESSHGSKRKMISGMGNQGQGSEIYEQYADSTDFNALFGDAFINDLNTLPDDNKSWKSKRSRGSSKMLDDILYGTRTRNRSGSASGRRSRLISMSGFSGISDVFDDVFNNHVDLDVQAEQFFHTLNNLPSEGSIDRPLSPELAPTLPAPVEFCSSCGFECRMYNGVLRCNHCSKYKESTLATSSNADGGPDEESRSKLVIPLSVNIKTESVSSGEKFINQMLMSRPAEKSEKELKSIKKEQVSPSKQQKRSNLVINTRHDDSDDNRKDKKKRKVQVMSPRSPNMISIPSEPPVEVATSLSAGRASRDRSRPKHYGYSKVEKTPPISASGHRHCVNCNGQVRPQMCGGNRHRWRCVDKKCRKWYGWVRSHEEIPKNVGRKKVGVKQPQVAVKPQKIKKKEEEEEHPLLKRKVGRPSKNDIKIRLKLQKEQAAAALAARATNQQAQTSSDSAGHQRRKYTKRKMKDGISEKQGKSGEKKEFSPFDEDVKKRASSPLNEKQASYRPCAMEKRARWWTGEKRRVDVSPERELGTTAADTSAAFRMMAHAVRSAAVTRADEVGTVNGSLDLLMDTLVGSMAPLLSLLQNVPAFQINQEVPQKLWNSSAIHIPTFQ